MTELLWAAGSLHGGWPVKRTELLCWTGSWSATCHVFGVCPTYLVEKAQMLSVSPGGSAKLVPGLFHGRQMHQGLCPQREMVFAHQGTDIGGLVRREVRKSKPAPPSST